MSTAHLPWLVTGSTLRPMNLHVALGKFRLQARHGAQFGGADGREVFGMRKQNCPAVADPVVKVDRSLRGFGGEIGGRIVDAGNALGFIGSRGSHDHLLYVLDEFGSLKIRKVCRPGYRLGKKRMKMKPTRFTGWAGKNLAVPYPHAGAGRQQHMALAMKVENM